MDLQEMVSHQMHRPFFILKGWYDNQPLMSDFKPLTLTIEGVCYKLDKPVFDLILTLSREKDCYKDFIEGRLTQEELKKYFPNILNPIKNIFLS
jgi:hypothetical protein